MIREKDKKISQIVSTIKTRISEINTSYRKGPDLYFYRKIIKLRSGFKNIKAFLNKDDNMESLYATLLSWDMNCRGAKMKYYDQFKSNILDCLSCFLKIENFTKVISPDLCRLNIILQESYSNLDVG